MVFCFRAYCSNCVCGVALRDRLFLLHAHPVLLISLLTSHTYCPFLKSCSFPPSTGPLTSIRMFTTSSYQAVLSRVVLQSSLNSSVHIAIPLGAGQSGVRFPVKAKDFFLPSTKLSMSAPRPTQTHSVGTWDFPAEGNGTSQCSCPLEC